MMLLDDELDRLFGDERLDLRPAPGSVDRVVTFASRRRTRRIVRTSLASATAAAAVVTVAVAVVGNQEQPTTMPAGPAPTSAPPTDDDTRGDDTGGEPAGDDPDRLVLEPAAGFGGVRLGMTVGELEQVAGIKISEFPPEGGRTEYCYGSYESDQVSGLISVPRGDGSLEPARSDDDFVVTTLSPGAPVETPEGVSVGAPVDDVRRAYPDLEVTPGFATVEVPGFTIPSPTGSSQVSWIFGGLYENGSGSGDVVEAVSLDAGQMCAG